MKIPLYRNDQHGAVIGFSHQKPTTSVVGGFTDAVMDVAYDADRELYIDIDDAALRGPDTVDGAVWINIAGPFDNQLAAQYYIDAEVAEDDGYY